jgi:predicted membrane protein
MSNNQPLDALPLWGLLIAAMGYHSGLTGTVRSLAILAVSFTFSVVIFLIADLDRPQEGFLTVSQEPLTDLRQSMK